MHRFIVTESSAIAQARRAIGGVARDSGFDQQDAGRAALIATEICGNLVKHGGGGELLARELAHGGHRGLELIGLDRGPGMVDVAKCLRDGFSTSGSPGTGLGAIERLSQRFDIYSQPDRGTAVMAQLWPQRRAPDDGAADLGAIVLPKPGETECGDAWRCSGRASGALVLGVDGLGHGLGAAQAAAEACRVFDAEAYRAPGKMPGEILQIIHSALRPTRGAAIAIADIDWDRGQVTMASIGNLITAIVSEGVVRRIASDNGVVGHVATRIRELHEPWKPGATLVMHSDGLTSHWQTERYPGLMQHASAVVAGVLYRDFGRGRDDSLVIVMKRSAP